MIEDGFISRPYKCGPELNDKKWGYTHSLSERETFRNYMNVRVVRF